MTKVETVSQAAGVICPKRTGEMDKKESCRECKHYALCASKILGAIL